MGEEREEIEIDVNKATPLSKKELRLLKKGKKTAEELESEKYQDKPKPKPVSMDGEEKEEEKKPAAKSIVSVWIGNLSYDTTEDDLKKFMTSKSTMEEKDITRVKLPKNGRKNRGFAYMDFASEDNMNIAITLSEQELNGRNLLIKQGSNFEGRPAAVAKEGNPPSRILFVGNLSFDTTDESLETHFRHCGEIMKIRMATFEDSGKCKGFAFIDFKDQDGPTKALKDRNCKRMMGRPLRMEFGEDRSQRKPKRPFNEVSSNDNPIQEQSSSSDAGASAPAPQQEYSNKGFQQKQKKVKRDHPPEYRMKSSIALATAQRASAAIVESKGKKITFD